MRCNLHILASSLMAISIFGSTCVATANHDGVGQGVVAQAGDSPAAAAPEIWHRASWGNQHANSGSIGDLLQAPVDATPELAGYETTDSSAYYEFQDVLPHAPVTETPVPWSTDPGTFLQLPLDACSCSECCGPTLAQITYARQCPGYQGLSRLDRLHARISLSDTPLCGGQGGCPPPKVMSADFTAVVFTRFVDKELVRSWLPKGLILDPDCPFQDCHPIIIMCGEQRRFARTTNKTIYPLWGRYYDEAFISIPWVKMAKSPQKPPMGLYAEQLTGTAFTAPRAFNKRTWTYRIRPSVLHEPFEPVPHALLRTSPFGDAVITPNQLRWNAFPIPEEPTDFLDGLVTIAGNGDAHTQAGIAIHIFAANQDMSNRFFYNADGELLLVAETGRVRFATELGVIEIEPGEIAVLPRGLKFQVTLPDGRAPPWPRTPPPYPRGYGTRRPAAAARSC